MSNETVVSQPERPRARIIHRESGAVPFYGLGFIGALVYFISHATTFWIGVLGVFKAIIWPALVVYRVLELLKF